MCWLDGVWGLNREMNNSQVFNLFVIRNSAIAPMQINLLYELGTTIIPNTNQGVLLGTGQYLLPAISKMPVSA